ncbi:MAG TPA: hypothetical protein VGO13_11395 [Solirubrobacterales bacterium]|nr:hypothetical protein [Solirubrobacterales bacterium]
MVVPYQLIVLALTGAGPLAQSSLSLGVGSLLTLIEMALVTPLISALHVHAVAEVRNGRVPRLASVAREGLRVLPVVAAASIASALGIGIGFLLLIVPGVILFFRWVVVAQATHRWLVRGSLSTHSVGKEPRNGASGLSGLPRFRTHPFGGKGTAKLRGGCSRLRQARRGPTRAPR